MKKLFIAALALFLGGIGMLKAQEIPDQKETLKTLIKVNDFYMKNNPDCRQPSYVNKMRPSNIWTRAVYYEGLMALYSIYPDTDITTTTNSGEDFLK